MMNENTLNPVITLLKSKGGLFDFSAYIFAPNQSFEANKTEFSRPTSIKFDEDDTFHIQLHLKKSKDIESVGALVSKPVSWFESGFDIDDKFQNVAFHLVLNNEIILNSFTYDLEETESKLLDTETRQKLSTLENIAKEFDKKGLDSTRFLKKLKDRPH
jgi:hypothetical protein